MFFKNKNTVAEDDILRVLSDVYDPDLQKNIVALGFVKQLKIQEGQNGKKVSF